MTNTATEQKKSLLQRVRETYRKYCHAREANKSVHDFTKAYKEAHPGVPRAYQNVNLSEFRWTSKSFTLGVFEKIVKMVQRPEMRESIVHDLDAIATGNTKGERVGYVQNRLGYTIFREVTGSPYAYPQYASLVKVQDVINRNFLDLIYKGVCVYKNAPVEIREKFNKAVMPRIKKEKAIEVPHVEQKWSGR